MVAMQNSHKLMPTSRHFFCTSRLKSCRQGTNFSHKPMLSVLYRMFLLHIKAQIVPSRELLWQTLVQYSLRDVSLIIQAGIVPRGTTPTNTCPVLSLGDVSHTHPGYNGAHRELLPQTHAKYALYWTFPVHIQAEMVPTGNSSHKSIPSTLSMGCLFYTSICPMRSLCKIFLTHPD